MMWREEARWSTRVAEVMEKPREHGDEGWVKLILFKEYIIVYVALMVYCITFDI